MLKFSLSTHTSLNKPNACLLSYIHIPYPLVSSRQFQILNSFFHDFLMMIQIFLIFSVLLFFINTNAIFFFFSFFLCRTLLLFSISPLIRTSIPVRFNDTSGVYIKLNAELYHLLTLILHNFPIFFPFVQWQYLWIYIIYIYGRTLSLQFFFSVTKREGEGFHWESVWLEQRTRDAGHRSCLF